MAETPAPVPRAPDARTPTSLSMELTTGIRPDGSVAPGMLEPRRTPVATLGAPGALPITVAHGEDAGTAKVAPAGVGADGERKPEAPADKSKEEGEKSGDSSESTGGSSGSTSTTGGGSSTATGASSEKITAIRERIASLSSKANKLLIYNILESVNVYSVAVDPKVFGIIEIENAKEAFEQNFNWGSFANIVGTGVLFGGGVGAAVGGVGYLAYSIISAIGSKKITKTAVGLDTLRKENITIESYGNQYFLSLALGKGLEGKKINPSDLLGGLTSKPAEKAVTDKAGEVDVPKEGETEAKKIYFTTFGDILNFIAKLPGLGDKLKMLVGGFIFDIDPTNAKSAFINFMNIPIYINSLSKFLHAHIEETERNFHYDSELFLTDVFEKLIRSVISSGQAVMHSLDRAVPETIKIGTTLHTADLSLGDSRTPDLLVDAQYRTLKSSFTKTKNINKEDAKLLKVYVFSTFEEIKYENFYTDTKGIPYTDRRFQQHIIEKYEMPCILIKNIADNESILKKKYVQFERLDNTHLLKGNYLAGARLFRGQYSFTADLKPYLTFFLDVGANLFIAPPVSNRERYVNMFGFGGCYFATGGEFKYMFQKVQGNNITLPNFDSMLTLKGQLISHGDYSQTAAAKCSTGYEPIDAVDEDEKDAKKVRESSTPPSELVEGSVTVIPGRATADTFRTAAASTIDRAITEERDRQEIENSPIPEGNWGHGALDSYVQ